MAKVKLAPLVKLMLQKAGVYTPEKCDTVLALIEAEIEEDIEGETEQNINGLFAEDELEKNPNIGKKFRDKVKAETFNGFETMVLKTELASLTDAQKAEYERKPNATEKTKYIFKALKENGSTNKDLNTLQQKIDEYEGQIADGSLVSKTEVETHKNTIKELKMGRYYEGIAGKLKSKPLTTSFLEDPDFEDVVRTKVDKFAKSKNMYYDIEDSTYKTIGTNEVVKKDKTVKPYTQEHLIEDFLASNQGLLKKSDGDGGKVGNVIIEGDDPKKGVDPNEERARERAKARIDN